MNIREDQFKEVDYLRESLRLLTDVHEALIKMQNHIADRVNKKSEEAQKMLEIAKEKNKWLLQVYPMMMDY